MLSCLKNLGHNVNVTLHYLSSHLDHLLENLGHFSGEKRNNFHREIRNGSTIEGQNGTISISCKIIIEKIIFGCFRFFFSWFAISQILTWKMKIVLFHSKFPKCLQKSKLKFWKKNLETICNHHSGNRPIGKWLTCDRFPGRGPIEYTPMSPYLIHV